MKPGTSLRTYTGVLPTDCRRATRASAVWSAVRSPETTSNERDEVRRVPEVRPAEALRVAQPGCDGGDGQAGRHRAHDIGRPDVLLGLRQDTLFEREVLVDRLHHEDRCAAFVWRHGPSQRRGDAHARPGRRGLLRVDQAVVGHEPQQRGDPLGHGRASPFIHVHQPHGVAGQGEDQAGRHADQAGADDSDSAGLGRGVGTPACCSAPRLAHLAPASVPPRPMAASAAA